jgi:uncharacterized membrane protein SirB2
VRPGALEPTAAVDYPSLKLVHQTTVVVSVCGFILRGAGSLCSAAWARGRAAKTLPHIIDTVLLLSAVALAWSLRLNPFVTPWLLAKIVGLVVYIGLGTIALRPGRPLWLRSAAWLLALATVGYIASVAITKSPWGLLGRG